MLGMARQLKLVHRIGLQTAIFRDILVIVQKQHEYTKKSTAGLMPGCTYTQAILKAAFELTILRLGQSI